MDQPIEIQKKRRPAFLFALILLGVGAGAEWLFFRVLFPQLDGFFSLKVTAAVVVAALIIWAIGMVFKQTSRKTPGLIIQQDGLVEQSNMFSVGFIPWGDITGFRLTANELKSDLIVVMLRDPRVYLDKFAKYRASRYVQFKQFGSPVVISAGILEIHPSDLMTLLQARLETGAVESKPPALPSFPGQALS